MSETPHDAQITAHDYGPSHGIRIECTCGAYWVMPQPKGEPKDIPELESLAVEESLGWHRNSLKKPPIKPD